MIRIYIFLNFCYTITLKSKGSPASLLCCSRYGASSTICATHYDYKEGIRGWGGIYLQAGVYDYVQWPSLTRHLFIFSSSSIRCSYICWLQNNYGLCLHYKCYIFIWDISCICNFLLFGASLTADFWIRQISC